MLKSAPRAFAALLLAFSAAAFAQAQPAGKSQEYTPSVGQEGKDVIWVPTPNELIAKMLDMAKVTPNDFVVDLGSGDGRTVIAAAKRGAKALGIEYNPDMVELSKKSAQKEGVTGKANFVRGDIFETDFTSATVVTMYLLPNLNLKLRPKLLDMKPGTRLVSHAFTMDDWKPDQTATADGRTAYLWIVPAKVEGTWQVQAGGQTYTVTLSQKFQELSGSAKAGGKDLALRDGKLDGENIAFVIDAGGAPREFRGRVSGNSMNGMSRAGSTESAWTATRSAAR